MNSTPIVDVRDLTFSYPPSRRGREGRPALRGVSLQVNAGEIFGLLGPNGGGKTTLFRILSTLLLPDSGTVHFMGLDAVRQPLRVRRLLGVGFQSPSLDRKLTVEENLRHQGHLYGLSGTGLRERITGALTDLGVDSRRSDLVETLSGGLARRVELAKTMLHRPAVLLLDEPSTGIDPGARRDFWQQLKKLKRTGDVTILLTTHLMEEAEECDRLALLDEGKIVAEGSPAHLKAEIGGEVAIIQTKDPEWLQEQIRQHFNLDATVVEGNVRVERRAAHQFVPQLVEAFPGRIEAISAGKPTLEDVFVHQTGHSLWERR